MKRPSLTLGVEEEFQLVDRESGDDPLPEAP